MNTGPVSKDVNLAGVGLPFDVEPVCLPVAIKSEHKNRTQIKNEELYTMKRSWIAILALACVVVVPGHRSASAQDATQTTASPANVDQAIDLLRKDIRSQKKQLIAANVPLTDAEAQAFWPVYDRYTAELVATNNDKYALIKEYGTSDTAMTDAQADNWTTRLLKLDVNVANVRLKYQPEFRKVLGAKKAALYEQVERKAQMLIDIQIAMQIPLVQP